MISGITPRIERILAAGNNAPSGENCQPWRFVVRGNAIEVHLLPERDQSAYSWGQRASYLANGAAIENMVIAASAEGYRTEVHYFPNSADAEYVANIILTEDASITTDLLAAFIEQRISNRKPYRKDTLISEERKSLETATNGKLLLTEDSGEIIRLGRIGSTNEEVMLANKSLHQFFFNHVSWTKEEDDKNKIGFYIKTLELPPPAEKMFKFFSNWRAMRLLAALGFNRIIAKQNAMTNSSAAAIGAITLDAIEPLDFVKIGRTIERLWLTATSLNLSFQPLTGVFFFKLKIDGGDSNDFSEGERQLIERAYQDAASIFKIGDQRLVFMFRIGHGDVPSAHAVRFPLADVVTAAS